MKMTFNGPQQAYLSSTADVLLFGGGAGSGKSYVAIVDLLGLNESPTPRFKLPYYRALIYRKRRGDLVDLIDKSKKIYPMVDPGAIFNNTDSFWTFSSGAKIYFKYFERLDQAETWLQGQELACVCAEEVGQHEDDRIFRYALSRLRNSEGLRCYMRATCNPSKYKWLRNYFRIDDIGSPSDFFQEFELSDGTKVKKRIKFIPAKLSDNPHLPKEYAAQLMLLPEDERLALLNGRWDSYSKVPGMIYEAEIDKMVREHRHCKVAHDPSANTYTVWDLGWGDHTIVLFVQWVGKEIHVIDKIEDNNKRLDEYAANILRLGEERGYKYAKHLVPHDAKQHELQTGLTRQQALEKVLGSGNVEVLPRLGVEDGINKTREIFPNLWIDKDTDVLDQLRGYCRKLDSETQKFGDPIHHDLADAVRYISYYTPQQPAHRIRQRGSFRGSF